MSSYRVIIKKGEIFLRRWNSDIRQDEEKRKEEQALSNVLQCNIEIHDTTFGQFFDLIAKEADFYERVFKASMYGHPIKPYIEEIAQPAKNTRDMDFVRVGWYAEQFEDEIQITSDFDGYGDWPEQEGMPGPTKGGIAIEFTPLNEYKDLELKLDTKFELMSLDKKEPIAKGLRDFTVYAVIHAILYEITWAGDISKGRKGCPGCEAEK